MSVVRVPEIRRRIVFTVLLLIVYRLGSQIPAPGVDVQATKDVGGQFGGNGVLGLLNTFTGGGLSQLAIFALGVTPYVTASIIVQLLTVVVPSLEKLQKDGEVGIARITQYTRYLTIGLALALYWLHTHARDGIVHIESPIQRTYTLGDFFDIWRQPLSRRRGAGARGPVTAYVDGRPFIGDPRTIALGAHRVVQLDVRRRVPPNGFSFPSGL
jgi:SecY